MKSVFLQEMTREEFRELIDEHKLRVMIVLTGSIEQHYEHLAMVYDTAAVTAIAELAAQRLFPKVVVTPPLVFGVSEHWMGSEFRAGTLSARPNVFQEILFDICHSLQRHGVRNILILNGHGGNRESIATKLPELRERLGIKVSFHSYWGLIPKSVIKETLLKEESAGHAGEFETSMALYLFPERVRKDKIVSENAKLATVEKGDRLFKAAVDSLVSFLEGEIAMLET